MSIPSLMAAMTSAASAMTVLVSIGSLLWLGSGPSLPLIDASYHYSVREKIPPNSPDQYLFRMALPTCFEVARRYNERQAAPGRSGRAKSRFSFGYGRLSFVRGRRLFPLVDVHAKFDSCDYKCN